jgi:hypothetical protein
VVELAVGVDRVEIDRRRQDPGLERADAEQRLGRARRAEHVAGHRLGRGHRETLGVRAEHRSDRARLARISRGRARRVRVHVFDVGDREIASSIASRMQRCAPSAFSVGWAMCAASAVPA